VQVLGFPCNQFGAQEPGTNREILEFATSKYRINFQLFSKIEVNGDGACDLYKALKAGQPNDDGSEDVTWNFTKFLINGYGKVLKRYDPKTTPEEIEVELGSLKLSLSS
jgi:glutathione peroxidase